MKTRSEQFFEAAMHALDFKELIKDVYFDGHESHDDYVKYGDAFVKVERHQVAYTPMNRQLVEGKR